MTPYHLPNHLPAAPGFLRKHGWWLACLLVIDALALLWWLRRDASERRAAIPPSPEMAQPVIEPQRLPGLIIGFPTVQDNLLNTNAVDVFMPTASGRPESALYGSTRTTQQGKAYLPSFHEGIDIGPVARDRKQAPLDHIFAIADGRVAHINRITGNSNYGRYIVVVHDDPIGEIYSLYAHLGEIPASLKPGQAVRRGDDLGLMGNTPPSIIPMARAHLHLEVGMVINHRFRDWFNRQKLKPDHGIYHGHNLRGINPLEVFRQQEERGVFSMAHHLARLEPAFTLVVRTSRKPDYFDRYPGLWSGDAPGDALVIAVAEGGAPVSGRPATDAEKEKLGRKPHAVLAASEHILGRNGLRLVVNRRDQWQLGTNGERWLEILMHR